MHKEDSFTLFLPALFAILCALISIYFLGSPYSSFFNADGAVQVIMAQDFSLDDDFYYWGQNRLGSLLPILASLFIWTGIKPIYLCVLINYILLTSAGIIAMKFVSALHFKLLVIFLFLIPCHSNFFIVQLSQPYSLQIVLLLIPLVFFYHEIQGINRYTNLKLILSGICFAAAIYVHDASFIYVVLFFVLLWHFDLIGLKKTLIIPTCSLGIPLASLSGYILFRKFGTPDFSGYSEQSINQWSVFINTFFSWTKIFKRPLNDFIGDWALLESFVLVCLTALVLVLSLISVRKHAVSKINAIPIFLIVNATVFYTAICLSGWYVQNDNDGRYMIFPVCMMLITTAIFLDSKNQLIPMFRPIGAALLVLFCASSLASTLRPKHRDGLQLTFSQRAEIDKLLGAGIIGSYWYSYPFSAHAPSSIASTPHDKSFARSSIMVEKTLRKDSIYLVKNSWLEEFSDTIPQYGITLTRVKPYETVKVGNAILSRYQKAY